MTKPRVGRAALGAGLTLSVGLSVALSVLLAACGDSAPTTADLKEGLGVTYDHQPPLCWNVKDGAHAQFPLHVAMASQIPENLGILDGLNRSGIAKVTLANVVGDNGVAIPVLTVEQTDKGQSAHAWDPVNGFCVGRHQVVDIVRVDPPKAGDEGLYDVHYTWTYDAPAWVERDKYPKLVGMATPGTGEMYLKKTDQGWRVDGATKP